MKAVYKYDAIRFDGTAAHAMDIAKFVDGAEVTIRYDRYPDSSVHIILRPTVDYVDWDEFEMREGDVLVHQGVGQRFWLLKGSNLEGGSYPYITFEED